MATHSSVLAWRIPGTAEPGGSPSTGPCRLRLDWSVSAAASGQGPQLALGLGRGVGGINSPQDWGQGGARGRGFCFLPTAQQAPQLRPTEELVLSAGLIVSESARWANLLKLDKGVFPGLKVCTLVCSLGWVGGACHQPSVGFSQPRELSGHPACLCACPHSRGAALGPAAQPCSGLCSLPWSRLHLPEHPHWDHPGGLCRQLPGGPSSRARTGAAYPESSLREVTDGGKGR